MFKSGGLAIAAVVLALCFANPTVEAQRTDVQATIDLFESYTRGDVVTLAGRVKNPTDLRNELKTTGRSWVDAATDVAEQRRRRHVLALVALDGAIAATPPSGYGEIMGLLEWGCAALRGEQANPFERDWLRGSIIFGETRRDELFLFGGEGCRASTP